MGQSYLGMVFVALAVLDAYLLVTVDSLLLASGLAFLTVIILFRTMTFGLLTELALLGAFLTYIAAYHFYLQPITRLGFPIFSDTVLMFVAVFLIIRATVVVGKTTGLIGFSNIAQLVDG
jgi:hypothetical protein